MLGRAVKYFIAFNVLDRATGRPTPLKVSCEFKDMPRATAVLAMRRYASEQGILVGGVPSSIRSFGGPPRGSLKVRLPSL